MSEKERRATPRFQIRPGSFAFYALGQGVIQDMSLGGVYIEDAVNAPRENTELVLELRLERQTISLRGVVRRVQPGRGFAVEFLPVPPETREQLRRYFQERFGAL